MPQLFPISAVTFNPSDSAGDISSYIAPPYDVLDQGPKENLLQRDPHNIVAIDLPVTPPKTVGPDSAYHEAGQTFRHWLDSGVLQRSAQPAVFAYEQEYQIEGKTFRRCGLFANLQLQEFNQPNGIYRHEMTIQSGLDDRYKLMEATEAQLSPIFGIYSDRAGRVTRQLDEHFEKRAPDFYGVTDHDDVIHRCWRIEDQLAIAELQQFFADTSVFIADGHHRYTTALEYHRNHKDMPAAVSCLFVLVAAEDPGMIVLPTHRVIHNMQGFEMDSWLEQLAKSEQITVKPTDHGRGHLEELEAALPDAGYNAKGLFDPATGRTYILTNYTRDPLAPIMPDQPAVWRQLYVVQLHNLLIDRVLRPNFGGDAIGVKYTADLQQMRALAEAGNADDQRLAVILQPPPLEDVLAVSLAGQVMLPKSTYFFPKLATGLVIQPLS
jgi:uncharacterized protein (DUF1015 family)